MSFSRWIYFSDERKKTLIGTAVNLVCWIVFFLAIEFAMEKIYEIRWLGSDETIISFPEAKKRIARADLYHQIEHELLDRGIVDKNFFLIRQLRNWKADYARQGIELIPEGKGDAERALLWYIYIHHDVHADFNFDYMQKYGKDQALARLEETWKAIELLSSKKIEDPNLVKKRFGAVNNLALEYIINEHIYFLQEDGKTVAIREQYADQEKYKRVVALFDILVDVHAFYKREYPEYYLTTQKPLTYSIITYLLSKRLLLHEVIAVERKFDPVFCKLAQNAHLSFYLGARKYIRDASIQQEIKVDSLGLRRLIDEGFDSRLDAVCGPALER